MKCFSRFITKTLVASMVAMSFVFSANAKKKKDPRPNIIFFIADDMTRDMFNFLPEGIKSPSLTPNMDRLAKEGAIMMGQHVVSSVCTPSRYNCLTGNYASRAVNPEFIEVSEKNNNQRVVQWNSHILQSDTNLVKILRNSGYRTGGVGKNHVFEVEDYVPIPLSADANDSEVMARQILNYKNTVKAYFDNGFDFAEGVFYENPDFNGPKSLAVHNLDWSTEAALKFIGEKNKKPFFLYFATTIPHGPTEASVAWNANRKITPIGVLDKAPTCLPDKSTIPARLTAAGIEPKDQKCNLLWMDDAIGALFKKLEETKQLDNTIIFFFNDHGQYAKGTVYEGGALNPSIIWKSNGFKSGNIVNQLLSNVDFMPTILDMAKVSKSPYKIDGRSFYDVLNGKPIDGYASLYHEVGYTRGVRKGNFKYIALRYPKWVTDLTLEQRQDILDEYNKTLHKRGKAPNNLDPNAPFGHVQIIPGGGDAEHGAIKKYPYYSDSDQLYDLSVDPKEQVNLYNNPKYAAVVKEMREELTKYINTIDGGFGEFKKD